MRGFRCLAYVGSGDCEFFSNGAGRAVLFRMIGVNSSTATRSLRAHLRIVLYPVSIVKRLHLSTFGI